MFTMQIQVEGDEQAIRNLEKLDDSILDFSKELNEIGKYLTDFFQNDVFATEGGIFGMNWKGLSEPYKWLKQVKFPGAGTLVASGAMQKAFEYKYNRERLVIKNTADYFPYHQMGAPGHNLPKRVVMKIDNKRKNDIVDILRKGLNNRIKNIYH